MGKTWIELYCNTLACENKERPHLFSRHFIGWAEKGEVSMKESGLPQSWQVAWKKEEKKLKLRGEPVLSLAFSWPEIQRGGRGKFYLQLLCPS